MQTVTIHNLDNNKTAILKALAEDWNKAVEIKADAEPEHTDRNIMIDDKGVKYYYLKGVRVDLAKKSSPLEEISGSLTHLDLDAKELRKKWDRSDKF